MHLKELKQKLTSIAGFLSIPTFENSIELCCQILFPFHCMFAVEILLQDSNF